MQALPLANADIAQQQDLLAAAERRQQQQLQGQQRQHPRQQAAIQDTVTSSGGAGSQPAIGRLPAMTHQEAFDQRRRAAAERRRQEAKELRRREAAERRRQQADEQRQREAAGRRRQEAAELLQREEGGRQQRQKAAKQRRREAAERRWQEADELRQWEAAQQQEAEELHRREAAERQRRLAAERRRIEEEAHQSFLAIFGPTTDAEDRANLEFMQRLKEAAPRQLHQQAAATGPVFREDHVGSWNDSDAANLHSMRQLHETQQRLPEASGDWRGVVQAYSERGGEEEQLQEFMARLQTEQQRLGKRPSSQVHSHLKLLG